MHNPSPLLTSVTVGSQMRKLQRAILMETLSKMLYDVRDALWCNSHPHLKNIR